MSGLLTWNFTSGRADRRDREAFQCTTPAKPGWDGVKLSHTRAWELSVQAALRSRSCRRTERLLMGRDGEGIGAMCMWREDAGPGDVFVIAAAVATRFRSCGGQCADEVVEEALSRMAAAAMTKTLSSALVSAKIHISNEPSQKLAQRMGFALSEVEIDHGLWVRTITL